MHTSYYLFMLQSSLNSTTQKLIISIQTLRFKGVHQPAYFRRFQTDTNLTTLFLTHLEASEASIPPLTEKPLLTWLIFNEEFS